MTDPSDMSEEEHLAWEAKADAAGLTVDQVVTPMAEQARRCQITVDVSHVGGGVLCGRPAHRVSEGRHYCREHFDTVIDGVKTDVAASAAKLCGYLDNDTISDVWKNAAYRELHGAVGRLKGLGYEPGD